MSYQSRPSSSQTLSKSGTGRSNQFRAPFDPQNEPPVWAISTIHVVEDGPTGYHPPSLEFEQMALAAMLMLERDAITKGMARLHPRHFRFKHHRWVFEAIQRLERRRQMDARFSEILRSIDPVAVWGEMDAAGHGNGDGWECCPIKYVLYLPTTCPSALNIDYYIDRVIELDPSHLYSLALQVLEPQVLAGRFPTCL